mmetsp:Transcript_23391/g.35453  ORF Transcript_23391/g.35453 Transcript_23391/m.35453 type:complete len:268 (+) Transcript_23391:1282-2085(+)
MTPKELLLVKDVPESLVPLITPYLDELYTALVPGKALRYAVNALGFTGGMVVFPGSEVKDPADVVEKAAVSKEERNTGELVSMVEGEDMEEGSVLPGSEVKDPADVEERNTGKVLFMDEEERYKGNSGDTKDRDEFQADISRPDQEKLAVKADDAEVPDYLWQEHLMKDWDWDWRMQDGVTSKVWTTEDLSLHVPKALTGFRVLALCWRKRKLRRQFEAYFQRQWENSWRKFKVRLNCARNKGKVRYSWDRDGHGDYQRWYTARMMP